MAEEQIIVVDGFQKSETNTNIPDYYKNGFDIYLRLHDEIKQCTFSNCEYAAPSNVAEIQSACIISCSQDDHTDKKEYIAKIIPYYVTAGARNGVLNEITIQNKAASEKKLSPEIKMFFLSKDESVQESKDGQGVVVMEKINGGTVHSQLVEIMDKKEKEKDMNDKITKLFTQVYTSLDELHKIKIYHGDAHLENFMYNKDGNKIFIIDFGHSKICDHTIMPLKILEDYTALRSAVISLSKSKVKQGKVFVLKGYGPYLQHIISQLDEKILSLEKNHCTAPAPVGFSRSLKKSPRLVKNSAKRSLRQLKKSPKRSPKRSPRQVKKSPKLSPKHSPRRSPRRLKKSVKRSTRRSTR
jgi:serine/threonine protein kinase